MPDLVELTTEENNDPVQHPLDDATIEEAVPAFINGNTDAPGWYVNLTKTALSRNITLDDWNTLCTIIQKVSKDNVAFERLITMLFENDDNLKDYTDQEVSNAKSELTDAINLKVDKTTKVNGKALSSDVTVTKDDVGLGNVANMGYETTPTSTGENLYITSKAVYEALQIIYGIISGLVTESQINTILGRLDSIEAIIGSDNGDVDNVINTLKEVIVVLNGLGEDASLLDLINAKVNQSDFNTLNSQINGTNGIATKVSFLYDSNANAYAEIKAQSGAIDILTTDWVANTGDTNYPYKWELSNGYLVGASYASVVFDKDSDTSMLSATIGIDEENGKVILYASELPSATISIQKIAIFNSANAYELYNQTLINQVASNTSAISDINNTKLPQYTKKSKTIGNFTASLEIADGGTTSPNLIRPQIEIKKDDTHKAQIFAYGNKVLGNDIYGINISVQNGSNLAWVEMTQDLNVSLGALGGGQASIQAGTHTLTFDANGALKIDGNAVGGGTTIPTLTITQSQLGGSGITLTQEQISIMQNNNIIIFDCAYIGKKLVMQKVRWDGIYSQDSATPQTTIVFTSNFIRPGGESGMDGLQIVLPENSSTCYMSTMGFTVPTEAYSTYVIGSLTPTEDNGDYYFDISDIEIDGLKEYDLLMTIDASDKASKLYQVDYIDSEEEKIWVLDVASFGGGYNWYKFQIGYYLADTHYLRLFVYIPHDEIVGFPTIAKIMDWLVANGYDDTQGTDVYQHIEGFYNGCVISFIRKSTNTYLNVGYVQSGAKTNSIASIAITDLTLVETYEF